MKNLILSAFLCLPLSMCVVTNTPTYGYQPAPVYFTPRPVYVTPAPVYRGYCCYNRRYY